MNKPLTLGVAGLGTVGSGLLRLIASHADKLAEAAGRPIVVTGVSARTKSKPRGPETAKARWFPDPVALATDPGIDVFVELIGGDDGVAKAAVEAALKAGKHVVTANKALLAKHGIELAKLAEKNGVALNFEAAVAGAIPVIKTLRESLAANEVRRVYGILNGTCNYILTRMEEEHLSFDAALKEAQEKGYAESDPTFDVGGFDAAHKLALLTSLAFGTKVAFEEIHVEGIQQITAADIKAAAELGYCIKLLGVATQTESGIEARVNPTFVSMDSAISEVDGVTNCVALDSDFAGTLLLVGAGAGSSATASSVASDILDIARGIVRPPFVRPVASLKPHKRAKIGAHQGAYYVRLSVMDKPGAMAGITKRMGDRNVSLESIVQRRPRIPPSAAGDTTPTANTAAPVILVTHETTEKAIREALAAIESDGNVAERPQLIRIEEL
jgi:homoserine dehydrogenase